MADPHVITALVKKRSQLAGDLASLDRQRRDLRRRISFVDQALREFGYDGDPSEIQPRKTYKPRFRRYELRRLVSDVLRDATQPMTNADIAKHVIASKGWDSNDAKLLGLVASSVNSTLRGYGKRRAIGLGRGDERKIGA